jgi:ATP-dependent Clp protease ATP-binding subunit ClpC
LTDNVGRIVDFKNTIVIMTTNIGAGEIISRQPFGLGSARKQNSDASYVEMKTNLKAEMEKAFKPEFLNRLDDIIVFRGLTDEDLKRIIDIELIKVSKRLAEKGLKLNMTEEAKEFLIKKGSNKEYGARPLRRAIEQNLEDPMAEDLLRGVFSGKDTINVVVQGEGDEAKLVFVAVMTGHGELVGAK